MTLTPFRSRVLVGARADRIDDIGRFGDATALVLDDRVVTHAELDELVGRRAAELGTQRRLLVLEAANELEPVVTYLAALRGRHPVLLAPSSADGAAARHWERIVAGYRPDGALRRRRDGSWSLDLDGPGGTHDLHPDLAVLLGTSGSTGTPKLVRLSHDNLVSNALAIAEYLGLDGDSRAATTLPLQYCYGLSVLNSHLVAGGSLWLTDGSVVDPGFLDDFARAGATSFAGVPYTFQLLERTGTDWLATPGLRQVTQAGGRLAPDVVADLARRAERRDVELFVMYGQTEATARMAYLPPHLAARRSGTIGIPIPGGDLRIDTTVGSGERDGELVYTGPNVMMGYATTVADLARGHDLTELRTGDLAVQHDDGLYEIVGRCNRIAKLFGTRLDLDLVERLLAEHGVDARATHGDDLLTVHLTTAARADEVAALVAGQHCVPAHAVVVDVLEAFPVTSSGKTDYRALQERSTARPVAAPATVREAFTGVFGAEVRDDDTFTSLAGDSLSYVELYVRLERALGVVPEDWPHRTVAALAARPAATTRWWGHLETPIVLRALAILLVVGSHVDLWDVKGGAHVLLAAFGFNLARFVLPRATVRQRLAATGRAGAEMMVPVALWAAGVVAVGRDYDWPTAVALNNLLGPDRFTDDWWLWFIEAALWSSVALAAVLAVPWVHRRFRTHPFAVALGLAVGGLLVRASVAGSSEVTERFYSVPGAFWCVALGAAVAVAQRRHERVLVSLLAGVAIWGWFDTTHRDLVVLGGVLALVWVPRIPLPRVLAPAVTTVAAASLFIYLTHWQVYPRIEDAGHRGWALVASFALGTAVWFGYTRVRALVLARVQTGVGARRYCPQHGC